MDQTRLHDLLSRVRDGALPVEEALEALRALPFAELPFARVDSHRALRCGFPEVIFCQGKTTPQIAAIAGAILAHSDCLLATRVAPEVFEAVRATLPAHACYHPAARCITVEPAARATPKLDGVLIVSAGTADIPVAEEARVTAEVMGNRVETVYDAGVAGLHRLLAQTARLFAANVVIVVAGMEGALASVVGGLVDTPVIAVPTSVGYGASFNGLAPLLTMLNSCAAGVTVVNIDNGYGAGHVASLINQQTERGRRRGAAAAHREAPGAQPGS